MATLSPEEIQQRIAETQAIYDQYGGAAYQNLINFYQNMLPPAPAPTPVASPAPTVAAPAPAPMTAAVSATAPVTVAAPAPSTSLFGVSYDGSGPALSDIASLYSQILGRSPDTSGLQFYDQSNRSLEQIRQELLNSPEYLQTTGTSPAPATTAIPVSPLISNLYNQYVGANDIAGQQYWQNLIGEDLNRVELRRFLTEAQKTATGDYATRVNEALAKLGPDEIIYDETGQKLSKDQILVLTDQLSKIFDPTKSTGGVYSTSGLQVGFLPTTISGVLGKDPAVTEQLLFDAAARLLRMGVTDLSQLTPGEQSIFAPDETGEQQEVGKQPGFFVGDTFIPATFGETYQGKGGTAYTLAIDPATNKPYFYTEGFSTSDLDKLGPLLAIAGLALGGSGLLGSLFGSSSAAAGAGLTGADLAIALGEGLVPIASTAGQAGAVLGNLGALGAGIGLGLPAGGSIAANLLADAEFIAADAAQLAAQTGNNVAAIQQNLIAAGVDPIVAATAANSAALGMSTGAIASEIAGAGVSGAGSLFTGGSAADLALGGISTVTGAPAGSVIPGTPAPPVAGGTGGGGGTGTAAGAGTGAGGAATGTGGGAASGLGGLASGLLSNPSNLLSLLNLLAGLRGLSTNRPSAAPPPVGSIPTQGLPEYSPEYFQAMQNYYNRYMPDVPRNISSELSSWYNGTL